jgi:hypothetical protein
MTDQPVQPEAPTRYDLDGDTFSPSPHGDYIMAEDFDRWVRASQERPQLRKVPVSDDFRPPPRPHPLDHIATPSGVAQERPPIDVLRSALERTLANFEAVLARRPVRDATETIAEARAALAGGSVASPEPDE